MPYGDELPANQEKRAHKIADLLDSGDNTASYQAFAEIQKMRREDPKHYAQILSRVDQLEDNTKGLNIKGADKDFAVFDARRPQENAFKVAAPSKQAESPNHGPNIGGVLDKVEKLGNVGGIAKMAMGFSGLGAAFGAGKMLKGALEHRTPAETKEDKEEKGKFDGWMAENRKANAEADVEESNGKGRGQWMPGLRDAGVNGEDAKETQAWLQNRFEQLAGTKDGIEPEDLVKACQTLKFADNSKVSETDLIQMNKVLKNFRDISNTDSWVFRDSEISMGDVKALYK